MQENKDWSTIIGMSLIFLLLYLWMNWFSPIKKQEAPPQNTSNTETTSSVSTATAAAATAINPLAAVPPTKDSANYSLLQARYGAFAKAGTGSNSEEFLENDLVKIVFNTKGGSIKEVLVKNYQKVNEDTAHNEIKTPLLLMYGTKNKFELKLPVQGAVGEQITTSDLFFTPTKSGNTLKLRADAGNGRYLEQEFALSEGDYRLDYKINTVGLDAVLKGSSMTLNWENHLDKLEKNPTFERMVSTIYFKQDTKSPDYCDCRKDDTKSLLDQPVLWVSHSNQFFNTSLVANNFRFTQFKGETHAFADTDPDLKLLKTEVNIPIAANDSKNMTLYIGPNEYKRLQAFDNDLEDIIPFGWSIFGTINRWIILPLFSFLSTFVGNKGIVILLLTIMVKALVFPLSYKMIHSQSKMAALKPHLDELRKKFGDDQQKMSAETMKLYSEYGVNPLGGCFPIFLQMPIWFALYRFFPAAIDFRQAPFLWATDLSSFDVAFRFPFDLPFLGSHLSLFTIIWVITTLWYTWYSMRQVDMSSTMGNNPAMKYMQYMMPVVFLFVFNTYASGLSCYLAFSNIFNIGQTMFTKSYLINHDKIKAQLQKNKEQPKPKSGMRKRFDELMKEQQRIQAEAEKAKKEKKK